MKTIVQDYGPIYGEAVNGTVQGRPNGSVYVPMSNTISISIPGDNNNTVIDKYTDGGTDYLILSRLSAFVAQSQDLASYVAYSVFTDAECTTQLGTSRLFPAGIFNSGSTVVGYSSTDPTAGTSYYIRAQLINNGSAVATSNVLEVKGYDGE